MNRLTLRISMDCEFGLVKILLLLRRLGSRIRSLNMQDAGLIIALDVPAEAAHRCKPRIKRMWGVRLIEEVNEMNTAELKGTESCVC